MRLCWWIFVSCGLGLTTGCEPDDERSYPTLRSTHGVYGSTADDCVVGVALALEEKTATLSTCNEVNRTIEVWIDLYDCDDVRLPWSRVVVVSTNFDAEPFDGQWTFTHQGVDPRDGQVEACGLSWHFLETEQDEAGWIAYTGWRLESQIEPIEYDP